MPTDSNLLSVQLSEKLLEPAETSIQRRKKRTVKTGGPNGKGSKTKKGVAVVYDIWAIEWNLASTKSQRKTTKQR